MILFILFRFKLFEETREKKKNLKILIETFLVHVYSKNHCFIYFYFRKHVGKNFDNYAAGTHDSPTFVQLGTDSLAATLFQL